MPNEEKLIRVFISYSHDSREHLDRVLALADRLRAEGIDCNLDQYEPAPAEGWPRWMDKQFKDADFILVVCTETYCRRFEGREERGKGLGVKWEGAIITDELYSNEAVNQRFIPVLFSDVDAAHVPQRLQHYMRYLIAAPEGYEELYRRLTNQPRVVKPLLGKMRSLPPINRRQDFQAIENPLNNPEREKKLSNNRWKWLAATGVLSVIIWFGVMKSRNPTMPSFTENLGDGVKLVMVNLPGSEFTMGSNEYPDEAPPHQVKVSPFAISKYEITQAQWKALMGGNPSNFNGDDNCPVERVSWNQAQEFIKRLWDKTRNQTYRLPTEAEWEYAARAGSKGKYSFGDDPNRLNDYAWFERNSGGKTHPVGRRLPNAWGLFDMHGNVVEWCQDWYDENYYKQSPRENPQGPLSGEGRVLRGGSWKLSAIDCRATGRGNDPPDDRYDDIGFRVVCVARTS